MWTDLHVERGRGLQRRLYEALQSAILSGRLAAGTRLPPTRQLAEEAGISRQTAVLVYERLIAEGYLTGRIGAGTYVSAALQGSAVVAPPVVAAAALPRSSWAERAMTVPHDVESAEFRVSSSEFRGSEGSNSEPATRNGRNASLAFDFRPGVPDWEAFPHTRWRRLLSRTWRDAGRLPALGQYGDPAGYRPLREALAAYLARSRGLRCTAEQVVIVNGSQQALDLLARVCVDPGDVAAVEEPGYPPARAIFAAAGARLLPVSVDDAGLIVGNLTPWPPSP
ncbi:MAG: PLP-dependent aminotransferase family protein, partial [Chloroflexota bacterium]